MSGCKQEPGLYLSKLHLLSMGENGVSLLSMSRSREVEPTRLGVMRPLPNMTK